MPVTQKLSNAIGKLLRNITNPQWYVAEGSKQAVSIVVLNPLGQRVNAFLFGHLYHPETDKFGQVKQHHVADVFKCDDNHEYLRHGGSYYRYDPRTNTWIPA